MRLIDKDAMLTAIDKERQILIEQERLGAEHVVVHHARRIKCYMDSYYAGHTVDLRTAAILRDTVVAWHKEQKTQEADS